MVFGLLLCDFLGITPIFPIWHSLAQVPTEQSGEARMPFESIAADYFDLNGVHYLVTVDRLSGWLDVTRAASGTSASGAAGLVACLLRQGAGVHVTCDAGVFARVGRAAPAVLRPLPAEQRARGGCGKVGKASVEGPRDQVWEFKRGHFRPSDNGAQEHAGSSHGPVAGRGSVRPEAARRLPIRVGRR